MNRRQMLLAASACLAFSENAAAADQSAEVAAYLRAVARPIDIASGTGLAFDNRFLANRLFLLGEVHGVTVGHDLDLALLKRLHARARVRAYVAEYDWGQAALVNRYLASGDEEQLDRLFGYWRRNAIQWANREHRARLAAIRAWNDTLPPNERIRFHGGDDVQDIATFAAELAASLAGVDPAAWPGIADVRAALAAADLEAMSKAAALALSGAPRSPPEEAVEGLTVLAQRQTIAGREPRIAANIERLFARAEMRNRAAYGLWGMFHAVQAQVSDETPMALALARPGGALAGQVGTVILMIVDGRMMIPTSAAPNPTYAEMPYTLDREDSALLNGVDDLKTAARGPLTLFRLDARGSPYRRSDLLTRVGGALGKMQPFVIDPATAPLGVYAQYVVLSRGSPATTPV